MVKNAFLSREYMKDLDHKLIFQRWRRIWRHDWSSLLCTLCKQLWNKSQKNNQNWMGSNPCPLLRLTVFLKYSVYSYDHVFIELQIQYTLNWELTINRPTGAPLRLSSRVPFKLTTLEEFVNHLPAARDLWILLMLFQHPAWFISL